MRCEPLSEPIHTPEAAQTRQRRGHVVVDALGARDALERQANARAARAPAQYVDRPVRDGSQTRRRRTRAAPGDSDRRSPRLRRRRCAIERRRCVSPNTERLHQVQVYGQPRAVISDTVPMPWRSRQALRYRGRSIASRSGYGWLSRSAQQRARRRAVAALPLSPLNTMPLIFDRSGSAACLAGALAEAEIATTSSSSVCSPSPTTTTSAPASRYDAA